MKCDLLHLFPTRCSFMAEFMIFRVLKIINSAMKEHLVGNKWSKSHLFVHDFFSLLRKLLSIDNMCSFRHNFQGLKVSQDKVYTKQVRWEINHLLMAYLLSNICTGILFWDTWLIMMTGGCCYCQFTLALTVTVTCFTCHLFTHCQ